MMGIRDYRVALDFDRAHHFRLISWDAHVARLQKDAMTQNGDKRPDTIPPELFDLSNYTPPKMARRSMEQISTSQEAESLDIASLRKTPRYEPRTRSD